MITIGIDPGPGKHAIVGVDASFAIHSAVEMQTFEAIEYLRALRYIDDIQIACEWFQSYGMIAGREVFETVFNIGRIYTAARFRLIPRVDVKLHLCGSVRAKDANIRQALIDRFGPIGTKKEPGKLYGIRGSHLWAALAVAVTAADLKRTDHEWFCEKFA